MPYDKITLKPIYQQSCCKRIPLTGMWSSWRTVWSWKMSRTRLSLTGNLLPWSLTGGLISWSWIKHLLFQGVFDNIHNLHGDNDCCHPSVGALHNARIIFLVHFQGSIQGGFEVGGGRTSDQTNTISSNSCLEENYFQFSWSDDNMNLKRKNTSMMFSNILFLFQDKHNSIWRQLRDNP